MLETRPFSTHRAEVDIISCRNDSRNQWYRRQNTVTSTKCASSSSLNMATQTVRSEVYPGVWRPYTQKHILTFCFPNFAITISLAGNRLDCFETVCQHDAQVLCIKFENLWVIEYRVIDPQLCFIGREHCPLRPKSCDCGWGSANSNTSIFKKTVL